MVSPDANNAMEEWFYFLSFLFYYTLNCSKYFETIIKPFDLKKIYCSIYFEKIYYLIWKKISCRLYFDKIYFLI